MAAPEAGIHEPVLEALSRARASEVLPPGERLLVAVSGGGDSMALLHALSSSRADLGLGELVVAHVDHRLRPCSVEDAALVEEAAGSLGHPFVATGVSVGAEGGLQAAARKARHEALERLRASAGAALIVTAHSADDQAETLLLRLARGASVSGLAGMRPRSGSLARPLLDVSRAALLAHCERWGVLYRSDPANHDARFRRARVRHEILPLLESRLGPGVREALGRLARLAAAEDDLLDRMAARLAERAGRGTLVLDREVLLAGEEALLGRVLVKQWLRASARGRGPGGTPPPVEKAHLDRLVAMLRRGGSWRLELPGRVGAALSRGLLVFSHLPWPRLERLPLVGPGEYRLPLAGMRLLVSELGSRSPPSRPTSVCISWPRRDEVIIRGAAPGDRLADGPKVSEILRRAGVPEALRPRWPVLSAGDGVLWVLGLRSALPTEQASGLRLDVVFEGRYSLDGRLNQAETGDL